MASPKLDVESLESRLLKTVNSSCSALPPSAYDITDSVTSGLCERASARQTDYPKCIERVIAQTY